MKCFLDWIPLNTHVRFNETQPCIKSTVLISLFRILEITTYDTVCGLLLMEYCQTFRQIRE